MKVLSWLLKFMLCTLGLPFKIVGILAAFMYACLRLGWDFYDDVADALD